MLLSSNFHNSCPFIYLRLIFFSLTFYQIYSNYKISFKYYPGYVPYFLISSSFIFILLKNCNSFFFFFYFIHNVFSRPGVKFSFFFFLYLSHTDLPRPGIKSEPQKWQHWFLNPLSHTGTLKIIILLWFFFNPWII